MVTDAHLLGSILGIFLLAGTVKGVLGFGLPIITMSLLPFAIPVEQAIVLSAIVQPATNILQFATSGLYKRAFRISWPVVLALVPGIFVGANFLTALEGSTLLMLVGITIMLFSINELVGFGFRISAQHRVKSGLGLGFVAGVFGALTALNGWAFIMYLVGIGTGRQEFRSAIALLFLVSGFLISTSFWAVGFLNLQLFLTGLAALVPAFAGMWLGNRLGSSMPAPVFRRLLLLALIAIGGMIFLRGAGLFG